MPYSSQHGYYTEAKTIWGASFACAVVTIAIGFVAAAGIVDGEGRKDWHHSRAVPPGVAQVMPDSYLVDEDSSVTAAQICGGETSVDQTYVEAEVRPESLNGDVFVECTRDQFWMDEREASVNFASAMGTVITAPAFIASALGTLLLAFLIGLPQGLRERRWKRERREKAEREALAEREEAERERKALEAHASRERDALAAALASGAITVEQFSAGLDELAEKGKL